MHRFASIFVLMFLNLTPTKFVKIAVRATHIFQGIMGNFVKFWLILRKPLARNHSYWAWRVARGSYEGFLLYEFIVPVLKYGSNEFVALTNLCGTGP